MQIEAKEIRLVPITEIKLNPKNRNVHPPKQIEHLARILKAQGFRRPVTISNRTGLLVCGEGRYHAAKKLGATQVPAMFQDYVDESMEYADGIADNALDKQATLDNSLILKDVLDLGPDFDFDLLGIPDFKLPEDFNPGCDEDEIPEHVEPKTKLGDLYRLGDHRLLCGDSTDINCVARLMDGERALLMVTDPPYGVSLDQSWRDEALGDKAMGPGNKNTIANDDRADWYEAWAIAPAKVAYVWHASSFTDVVMESLRKAHYDVRQQIIWNKSIMVMGRSAYHFKHEPCWYAVRTACDANWKGDRKQVTVWDAAPPNRIMAGSSEDKTGHPTQKPVLLYDIPITNHTIQGDGIYEPFAGSGTAIIACEKAGRKCYAMELDPKYVDICVARWEKYTGKKAELING